MTRHARRVSALLGLVAILPSAVGCGGGSSAGYATPEACFEAMKAAAKKKDVAAMCDCMTDESQGALAGLLVMAGSMMKMFGGMAAMGGGEAAEEAQKALGAITAVLEKHGVTDDKLKDMAPGPQMMEDSAAIAKLGDVVSDKQEFIADMVAAMQQSGQGDQFNKGFDEQFTGELKDVKIDGDKATAVLAAPSGEQPVEFRKVAGGWKLHLDLDAMAAQRDAAQVMEASEAGDSEVEQPSP